MNERNCGPNRKAWRWEGVEASIIALLEWAVAWAVAWTVCARLFSGIRQAWLAADVGLGRCKTGVRGVERKDREGVKAGW